MERYLTSHKTSGQSRSKSNRNEGYITYIIAPEP